MPATDWLSKLPLELILMILTYLPIHSLVTFGVTSKRNYRYHALCMRKLHIGIFHKRLHSTIAFLDTDSMHEFTESHVFKNSTKTQSHQIPVVLPESALGMDIIGCRSRPRARSHVYRAVESRPGKRLYAELLNDKGIRFLSSAEQTIHAQNEQFAQIISRYGISLLELEFMAYDINDEGAIALSACCGPRLRHLGLRFEHPHVRDSMLSRNYWTKPAPGSPAWNALIGIGPIGKGIGMDNLESLVLERAGITPWQLQMLVKRNEKLRVLKLRTCAAAQPEFVNWLGGIDVSECEEESPRENSEPAPGALLRTLWIENCDSIRSVHLCSGEDEEGSVDFSLEWVSGLTGLQSLSLRECRNIDPQVVERANARLWHIPEVHLPRPIDFRHSLEVSIEVDPDYA
ncbi:F-box domain protein [Talaromyces proteolyticus]|uniref:F-box domain protein n=1 Tax=Talaromyces proteolyticus TaxID=1131652 RepID=A0AAD4KTR9_9EURO|nr:F-box domain protein [Talaromyces proteolyticus]KAH8700693.1 F-box domain protein [Talaromyces proteolyticus]